MRKAPDAFRTISEASDALQTPAHVLRFWESKFSQVKPVKRAGGRRYYRPADIDLLSGIRTLLHDRGMTIRGVQKLIQEMGVRHVAQIAPISNDFDDAIEGNADIAGHENAPVPSLDAHGSDEPSADLSTEAMAGETEPAAHVAETPPDSAGPETPEPEKAAVPDAEGQHSLPDILPVPAPPRGEQIAAARKPVSAAQGNAFHDLGTPRQRAFIRPAALAHVLRTAAPPLPVQLAKAAPLVERLEALLARMRDAS